MSIVKNSYGVSIVLHPKRSDYGKNGSLGGSSLDRFVTPKKVIVLKKEVNEVSESLRIKHSVKVKVKVRKLRTMSKRTKSKIRMKIISFSQVKKKLSFVTLTFCNHVEDSIAVKVLANFLNNVKKLSDDFQYLWIAEKQSKNVAFKDNIHFHLITNKYWDIEKWWQYWLDLQAKFGIVPNDESYRPSSAFDVKHIRSGNIKSVGNYLTKYVTKNVSRFDCQVWNCSKKISRLYTHFYSGMNFIRTLERLEEDKLLGGEIKTFKQDYCDVKLYPLNSATMPFYNKIEMENRINWKNL